MLSVTLLVFVVALVAELARRRWNHWQYFKKLGIPGPPVHFLWGHYHLVRGNHLYWLDKWAEEYGDIYGIFWGDKPVLVCSDVEFQQRVLIKDFSNFVNRASLFALEQAHPMNSAMLIFDEDSKWKNVRSVVSPSFSTVRMKAMMAAVVKTVSQFETNLKKQGSGQFDVYPFLKRFTLDNIGRTAFGIDANTQEDPSKASPMLVAALAFFDTIFSSSWDLLTNSFEFIGVGMRNVFWTLFTYNIIDHCSTKLNNEATKIVKARRNAPARNDLLGSFLESNAVSTDTNSFTATGKADDQGKTSSGPKKVISLTEEEVIGNSVLMILAGYETTSTAMAYIFHCLGSNPEVQEKLRNEIVSTIDGTEDYDSLYNKAMNMKYLDQVIKEALRIHPPVSGFTTRVVSKPTDYNGITLQPGLGILFPTKVIQRSPKYWSDPLTFNPERFDEKPKHPLAYQPFGDGPRNCVGMRLALMSIKVALCQVLRNLRITAHGDMSKVSKGLINQPKKTVISVEAI